MGFVDFTHCFASTDCQKTCKNVIVLVPTDDCSVHHRSQCKVLFESCVGHGKGNLNTTFETLPSQHPSCTLDHSCLAIVCVGSTASRREFCGTWVGYTKTSAQIPSLVLRNHNFPVSHPTAAVEPSGLRHMQRGRSSSSFLRRRMHTKTPRQQW